MDRKRVKQQVNAIMDSKSLTEAYKKTHNCTDETAKKNAYLMLKNPDIIAELEKQLDNVKAININKANLIKMLTMVVQNWQSGAEKTSDFLRAVELLSRLVPEFSDKHSVEHYQNMSDADINKELTERLKQINRPSGN